MLYTPGQGGAKQGASAHNGPGQFVATCGFLFLKKGLPAVNIKVAEFPIAIKLPDCSIM